MAKRKIFLWFGWLLLALLWGCSASWSQVIYSHELEEKLRQAEKSYSEKDYFAAEEIFLRLSKSFPNSPRFSYFQLMIAKCEYHLKEYSSAGEKFKRFIRQFPESSYLPTCYLMLGNIAYLQGEPYQSAQGFIYAYQLSQDERLGTLAKKSLEPLLERWLSLEELERLSVANKDKKLAPPIFFHLGRRNLKRKNHQKAFEALSYYRDNFPHAENAREVNLLLQERISSPDETVKVGVLLPLTGDFSIYGKSLLNGIKLALSSHPPNQSKVELEVKDTEGDYAKAAQLCRDLTEEDDVVCVIGPLRSESVVGSAVVAEHSHIPLITPTASKEGLALLGDFVFQLSSTPRRKGRALAEFVVRDEGLKDFVMLIPEGDQTESEASNFKEVVEELGGKILAVEHYPPDTRDFSPYLGEIKTVLLGFPSSSSSQKEGSLFDQVPVWVDGLFISAEQTEMYDILSRIANLNIFSTIIGTEPLGNDQVLGFARNIDREMVFASNSFAQNVNPQRQRLFDLYHELYQKEPDLVTMLGYDCMLLLLSVFENATSPEGIRNNLLSVSGFKGASGEIRFDSEGENISVPIYRLEREGVKKVR